MRRAGRATRSRPPAPRSRRLRAPAAGRCAALDRDRWDLRPSRAGLADRVDADALVAGIGHELRTPLTMMVGWTEVLRSGAAGELTPDQQRMVTAVERGATRVEDLVDDLLVLATDAVVARHCPCRAARSAYAGARSPTPPAVSPGRPHPDRWGARLGSVA